MLLLDLRIFLLLTLFYGKIPNNIEVSFYNLIMRNSNIHHFNNTMIENLLGSKAQSDTTKVHAEKSKVLPYQVRVGQCVGSLIKLDWIITARHCVSKVKYDRRGEKIIGYFEPRAPTVWVGQERRTIPTSDIFPHREDIFPHREEGKRRQWFIIMIIL